MEKVDYNEKERLAWSSYVFLEKEKQKKNLVGYRQYHMAPPKTATILLYYSYQTVESPLASQKIKKNRPGILKVHRNVLKFFFFFGQKTLVNSRSLL
jgi:hypothetical protein